MKKTRPSNILILVFVSILALFVLFAIGAIINYISNARESDEGLGVPEQELLN
jgi:hypothetical protein